VVGTVEANNSFGPGAMCNLGHLVDVTSAATPGTWAPWCCPAGVNPVAGTVVTELAELSPARRAYLLRRYRNGYGANPEEVVLVVRAAARRPCPVPTTEPGRTHPAPAPTFGARSAVAAIRARLIASYGPQCAACGARFGAFVDHDHDTDLVRGLLCIWCNSHVDTCPHLPTRCLYAAYLARPPAAGLALRYPNRGRPRPVALTDDVLRRRHAEILPRLFADLGIAQ
jgi:hypothetical protein